MPLSDEYLMRLAIKKARQGIGEGQAPFACCVVKAGAILSCEHNKVWRRLDVTAHASILAIREACQKLKAINLSGCTLYTTCEPCPMCLTAAHWAKVSHIVFSSRLSDAAKIGFSELDLSSDKMKEVGAIDIEIKGDLLRDESLVLLAQYQEVVGTKIY